ncbi:MAG: hypothetical protein QW734_10435 [Candidatus Bathyarchaeia archaeon]
MSEDRHVCNICGCLEELEDTINSIESFEEELTQHHFWHADKAFVQLDKSLEELSECTGVKLEGVSDYAFSILRKAEKKKWWDAIWDASLLKGYLFHTLCGKENEFLEDMKILKEHLKKEEVELENEEE